MLHRHIMVGNGQDGKLILLEPARDVLSLALNALRAGDSGLKVLPSGLRDGGLFKVRTD